MLRTITPLLILLAFNSQVIAKDSNLEVCTAGGYYAGAQEHFISGLAMHILQNQDQFGTKNCSALWETAYSVGVSFSKTGKIANENEALILQYAANFRKRVYSAISSDMGY